MPERRPYTQSEEKKKPFSRMAEGAGEIFKGATEAVGLAVQGVLEFFRTFTGRPSNKKHV
jgi:hypothetical protein